MSRPMKFLFAPIGIGAGLLAGFAAQKVFERIWSVFFALAVEGAILLLVKGAVDHGARSGFARLTGSWPGEQRPDRA